MESSHRSASEVAAMLDLKGHPEGGFFTETFRDYSIIFAKSQLHCPGASSDMVNRPVSTAIYFMLPSGSVSHLHCISCAETWHFYKGEPLTVFELLHDGEVKLTVLGTDQESGQRPQYTVPPNIWFGSFPTKDVESYSPDGSSLSLAPKRDG